MGLSKLSEACKKCPNVDSCDHKRMEALGCLPSPEPSKAAEIRIDGMSLSSDLYKSLGKQFLFTATSTAPSVITLNINEGTMTSATIEPLSGTSCARSGHAKRCRN